MQPIVYSISVLPVTENGFVSSSSILELAVMHEEFGNSLIPFGVKTQTLRAQLKLVCRMLPSGVVLCCVIQQVSRLWLCLHLQI